jgi:ClpP class serine protease
MPDDFRFDVFLSHSSKDKPVVRDIAERLKKDGVKYFLSTVKQARPRVLNDAFNGAKMYFGKQAVQHGLADGILSSWKKFISLL